MFSPGAFESVSESEWDISLELREDYTGTIIITAWEVGEFDHANVKRISGKWKIEGTIIEFTYDIGKVIDRFEFGDISLDPLGLPGAAPGVRRIDPIQAGSLIGTGTLELWKTPFPWRR